MILETLTKAGIRPTAHRVAVADFVLNTTAHPSADEVFDAVSEHFPNISRATVYNTLKIFTDSSLLRQLKLRDDRVVYDPKMERHHHLVDVDTGEIHDIDWHAVDVQRLDDLEGFEIDDYEVVLRGRRARQK